TFVDEATALARFAARMDPDALNLAMHRCDDNTLSTATDYNATANHATLQGTNAVDRAWAASYLGSPEIAGTSQPLSEGALYHGPTQPIDSTRELFRFDDRAPNGSPTLNARAKGLALSNPSAYTSPADGVIDIVGASDQPVTFGQTAGSPPSRSLQVPQLLK